MNELPVHIYQNILECLEEGKLFFADGKYIKAIDCYDKALDLVPIPKDDWQITTNIFVVLGDVYYKLENYGISDYYYNKALESNFGIDNAYVWYVLGRNYLKMCDKEKSIDSFLRAYMLDGKNIFKVDNFIYFSLIEDFL